MPDYSTQATEHIRFPETNYKKHPTLKMNALQWMGKKTVMVNEVSRPQITEPSDVIVKVTTSTICGSDLHLYFGEFSGMHQGDILGHEAVGIVDEVGSNVKNVKKGDKVVISAVISCGQCEYCQRKEFSLCDTTNPSKEMEKMYGHRTAALFGYSHLTGGYAGGQAEYVRVPFGDQNLLVVNNPNLKDDLLILLADVACTGFHATECADVHHNDKVVIFGGGPVGLIAAMWSFYRGAQHVVIVDGEEYRLEKAREVFGNLNELGGIKKADVELWGKTKKAFETNFESLSLSSPFATEPVTSGYTGSSTTGSGSSKTSQGVAGYLLGNTESNMLGNYKSEWPQEEKEEEKCISGSKAFEQEIPKHTLFHTINFHDWSSVDGGVVKAIQNLIPGGPDVCIDAVGFRFERGFLHTIERTLGLETDTPQILNDCIICCKKGGRLGIVGDYMNRCNDFAVGPLMEKSLQWKGGQVYVQRYWKDLLRVFESGQLNIDPTFIITHQVPLSQADKAYDMFANYKDGSIKILLKPELDSITL